ncbi:hypothetical protein GCM10009801_26150 [Streptomyces albiaxialis]|uniref:Uncharacterized protein n=1 Tax=Streptomyces albiaxialis TaxID=329523 RepID=A0ABN2VUR9_9ACTN
MVRGTRPSNARMPTTASPATNHIVARHPNWLPNAVPRGAPNAVAAVNPVRTTAIARPRRSDGTSAAPDAAATGTNSPVPAAATACATSSSPNVGASAAPTVPTR